MDTPHSTIKDCSLILTDKSAEFRNDEIYVVSINNSLFIKRLQMLPNNQPRVKSDNPFYDPFDISLDCESVRIIGKILWAGNNLNCIYNN